MCYSIYEKRPIIQKERGAQMRGGKREGSGRKSKGDKQLKVILSNETINNINVEFDGKTQSDKLRNCIKYGICNKKGLRVATVFSGIGAIEHALDRMKINYEIIFASDNGGVNIFKKKIDHNFTSIKFEFVFLKKMIDEMDFLESNEFLKKMYESLNEIKGKFIEAEKLANLFEDNELIVMTIDKTLEKIKDVKENKKEILKLTNVEIRDISDYYIMLIDMRKLLKNINTSEYNEVIDILNKIEKNKIFRKNFRLIKEITKLLSQQYEAIGTLTVLNELSTIKNCEEKKKYVDNLYLKYERANNVKKMYFENYDIKSQNFHWNVNFLDASKYEGKVDLYVGGSPCQSFSIVGKRGGFEDTRGTLFYEYIRILKEIKPRFFIYENVKGVLNHDKGKTWDTMKNTFEETGYFFSKDPYIFNAKDFGIPQNRERVFVVGFKSKDDFERFEKPKLKELNYTMKDFLEDSVDLKYFLPEKGINFVTDGKNIEKKYTQINGEIALCQKANQQFNWHGDFIELYTSEEINKMTKIDKKYFLSEKVKKYILDKTFYMNNKENEELIDLDIARPLTATMHKMHRAGVDNYISYGKKLMAVDRRIRKLTPRECFRLMGFSDSFNLNVSDTQLYHQAGNSIVVDVLISIVDELIKIY